MIKINEHINKMNNIKVQSDKSKGKQKLQLMKCYHKMQKQLMMCKYYLKGNQICIK